jgi:hypothetical protein
MGLMSIMGFEERKQVFPLIPDVDFITSTMKPI